MTFRQFVNFLRKEFPTRRPVKVRRIKTELDTSLVPAQRDFGETDFYDECYIMKINREDPVRVQKDTVMHEWAHCLTPEREREHHSDKWGIWYARIYRRVMEELDADI